MKVSGRSGSVHCTTRVPTPKPPDGSGNTGTGKAQAATGPAAIRPTHATDPGNASHQRARHAGRPVRRGSRGARANGNAKAAPARTGSNCQRIPTTLSTVADTTRTAADVNVTRGRAVGRSQRATTSATAPSRARHSGGDMYSPAMISVTRPYSAPGTPCHIDPGSPSCATGVAIRGRSVCNRGSGRAHRISGRPATTGGGGSPPAVVPRHGAIGRWAHALRGPAAYRDRARDRAG